MARKRMIDPSIWTDEGMAELAPIEQVLYIGLFSIADDEGRLKASPVYLRLALPTILADVTKERVMEHLGNVLRHMTQLRRYTVDGVPYLVFSNYAKWQRIDKPQPSQLPAPLDFDSANDPGTVPEPSANDPGTVPPNRKEEKRSEEKRTEENREVGARSAPKPRRKTRLSSTWSPTDANVAYAREQGMGEAEIERQAELFRDHWLANGETKDDWDATWRNWIRRAPQFDRARAPAASARAGERPNHFTELAKRLEAEENGVPHNVIEGVWRA